MLDLKILSNHHMLWWSRPDVGVISEYPIIRMIDYTEGYPAGILLLPLPVGMGME